MKENKSLLWAFGLTLGLALTTTAADAPRLTFKFATINVPGALETHPRGVNNAGVSVGVYMGTDAVFHSYILKGKTLTTLVHPNSTATTVLGINRTGAISVVGFYVNSSGNRVGFLYRGGKYTDIPGPTGATSSAAAGINDKGEIVGYYNDSADVGHGFLLKGKRYATLDLSGSSYTVARGINKSGMIVLYWLDSSGLFESSRYNGKTYKAINVPGAIESLALGISAAGDVIYDWTDSNGVDNAALFHRGTYYKFNRPKAAVTYGGGINDKNFIVGTFQSNIDGSLNGYKAAYK